MVMRLRQITNNARLSASTSEPATSFKSLLVISCRRNLVHHLNCVMVGPDFNAIAPEIELLELLDLRRGAQLSFSKYL